MNEEAVQFLVSSSVPVGNVPVALRLRHSRQPTDVLAQTAWDKREIGLREFAIREAALWIDGNVLTRFDHTRLLDWMRAPGSRGILLYFKQWEIHDVFTAITRSTSSRSDLWLRINELVDKRNNIAHGDLTVEATYLDVSRYLGAVRKFAQRADRQLGKVLGRVANTVPPW